MFAVFDCLLALLALVLFLALEFGHLFFGHLVILARSEHRAVAEIAREAEIPAAPLARSEASDAADRFRNGSSLDEKLADFFEEIVQMIWLERIGKALALEDCLDVFPRLRRHQEKRANAFSWRLSVRLRGSGIRLGQLLEYGE